MNWSAVHSFHVSVVLCFRLIGSGKLLKLNGLDEAPQFHWQKTANLFFEFWQSPSCKLLEGLWLEMDGSGETIDARLLFDEMAGRLGE
jgi:hypothetical protein